MASFGSSVAPAVRAVAGPRTVWWPCAFTIVASIAVWLSGVRGADYPAQLLRAEIWRRAGSGVWNYWWYGGHATPSYSVLVPPMIATVGALLACAIASVIGTYVFARLVDELTPEEVGAGTRMLAALAFAVCAVVNVVVGRTTFAVGLATGLLAMWAWHRQRPALAGVLALLTPLTSPIGGAFVALAAAAVGLDALVGREGRRFREALTIGLLSAAPLVVTGLLFPSGGRFPFRGDQLVFSLVVMGVAATVYRNRAVRIGLGLAALASIVLFLVPNPLGGNFLRFTQFVVVPVGIVGVSTHARRRAVMAGLPIAAAVVWSMQPGVSAAVQWAGDASVQEQFHRPLILEVQRRNADGQPIGRVEIPFTDNHWEAFFVASEVPYARGWERQTDLERNPELYDPELTRAEFHDWLHHNAVRWVAVPNVPLDEGGQREAEILESWRTIPWAELVWSNADWSLYEIVDYVPIVDPPARLLKQSADEVWLATDSAAVVTLRYEYARELEIDGGACVMPPTEDGEWMRVYLPGPGQYRIAPDPENLIPGVSDGSCEARADSLFTVAST